MEDQSYFAARIRDLIRKGAGFPAFSSFFSPEEAAEAAEICKNAAAPFRLFGGYPESERLMLAVSDWAPALEELVFPIAALQVKAGEPESLSNRDVLGALMACGIKREVLGDIIVRSGVVLFFAEEKIVDFLIGAVSSIGRFPVKLERAPHDFSVPPPRFIELRGTVASPRVDAVVAELCRLSREQACRLIEQKLVLIDHKPVEKRTREVSAGQTLTVRRHGKWIIDECSDVTKKGRIVLQCRKYD